MREHGPCRLAERQHTDPLKALIRAIAGQQLSTEAAATIFGRFEALFDTFPSATQVMSMPDDRLRGAGLSSQKTSYPRDLCRRIEEAAVTGRILRHLGVPTEIPAPRPARAPPLLWGVRDVDGWDDAPSVFNPCS